MAGVDPDPTLWAAAPAPSNVSLRRGAGVNGSDRITLLWPDDTIQTQWLKVTVKADANTALIAPDTFYFGNLPGDANGNGIVTIADIGMAKSRNLQVADITSPADFNRSGQITIADIGIAKAWNLLSIPLITAPGVAGAATVSPALFSTIPIRPLIWWKERERSTLLLTP